jgi:hypothetical protein
MTVKDTTRWMGKTVPAVLLPHRYPVAVSEEISLIPHWTGRGLDFPLLSNLVHRKLIPRSQNNQWMPAFACGCPWRSAGIQMWLERDIIPQKGGTRRTVPDLRPVFLLGWF